MGTFLSTAKLGAVLQNKICYLVSLFLWRWHLVLRRYLGIKHQIYLLQNNVSYWSLFFKIKKTLDFVKLSRVCRLYFLRGWAWCPKNPKLFWPYCFCTYFYMHRAVGVHTLMVTLFGILLLSISAQSIFFIKQSTDKWWNLCMRNFEGISRLIQFHFQSNYRWPSMYQTNEIRSTVSYKNNLFLCHYSRCR